MTEVDESSRSCPGCGSEVAAGLKSCPICHHLVHAERLKELAAEASAAQGKEDFAAALEAWREALGLLPRGAKQATVITAKIEELSAAVDRGEKGRTFGWKKGVAGLGALGLLGWKFKAIAVFALTKGKVLLLGLTKVSTLFGAFLSFGVYWGIWGWQLALGLIVSLYIHEMGHVFALKKFGIKATAPAFIPGLGAVVRLKQYPATPVEESRVGLAGPIWGTAAALAFYGLYLVTGEGSLGAIARFGAWINLFNLVPVPPLDGGRGFRAMNRLGRGIVTASMVGMWLVTSEGLLALLAVIGVFSTLGKPPEQGDRKTVVTYVLLVVVLSLMSVIDVPTGAS